MSKPTVTITNLRLSRNKQFSVTIPSLSVHPGTILAIVGTNGSGKTTLLESLVGLHPQVRAHVRIEGDTLSNRLLPIRQKIGYIPDDTDWFIRELTAREYLTLLADTYATAELSADDILRHALELSHDLNFVLLDQPVQSLSHGNKRKVQIIAGLMHHPKLIIIDELHNGLDPVARTRTNILLTDIACRGSAIIAATHDLSWAKTVATKIAVMTDGSLSQPRTADMYHQSSLATRLQRDTAAAGVIV